MKKLRKGVKTIYLILIILPLTGYAQLTKTDSLIAQIPLSENDSLKVDLLNNISYNLFTSAPDQAINFGNQAKELAEQINYQLGEAYAFKNIGLGYYMQGKFPEVLDYWNKSLFVFESTNNLLGVANLLNNLGAIYYNQGDDAKALEFYLRSLTVSEELNDELRIATALINIGGVYNNKKATYGKALEFYLKAVPYGENLKDNGVVGTASLNIGDIYLEQGMDSIALVYFEKSRIAWDGTGRVANSLTKIGAVYAHKGAFETAIKYQNQAVTIARQLNAKLELTRSLLGLASTYKLLGDNKNSLKAFDEAKTIASELGSSYELKEAYEGIANVYANLADFMNAYKYQCLLIDIKDTLFNIETDDKIKGLQFSYEMDKKQSEIALLTKDKELQDLVIERQRLVKNGFLAGLVLVFIIAFITFRNYLAKVKINKVLDKQKDEIENLLLNILPKKIAKELRLKGAATPRNYESVSVLFTDFKDFTKISAQLTPEELVTELNDYFVAFDNITEKYNLEKIKTIGDAYMCAGGLPAKNNTHPVDTVKAALEMQKFMDVKNANRSVEGETPWGLRVGIHTGSIMAGVVGRRKYAYDIWGSTVNVASRMESNGEVGKVNISATTFARVQEKFTCNYRGKISAKNVGEIDMYFVENEILKD